MTALARRNLICIPSPDGSLDLHYPAGDKPPYFTLSWDNSGLQTFAALVADRTVGTSFSSNVRQYLAGTNAATATLSVVTVSGTDAIANGWGVSGSNVTNPGTNAGSGSFKLGANDGTGFVYSNPISWRWTAAVSDVLAPCVPTGGAVVAGPGTLTFSCDVPGDANSGTNAGAMAAVQLRIAGSTVEEKTVPAGLSPTWTLINFGASTPVPSLVQGSGANGNTWTLSGGGAGIHGTTESFPFRYAQVSGNPKLSCKLSSFTSAADAFSSCGLMIRENITGLDRFVAFYGQQSDGSIQVKMRGTQGGSATNQLTSASGLALPRWLQMERTGSSIISRSSTDGETWTDFLTSSFALGATAFIGFFISSRVNGVAVSATLDQIWVSNQGRMTFTAVNSSSAKTGKFRARDVANNLSAESAGVIGTPLVTAYKKWNPGHGIRTNQAVVASSNYSALANDNEFVYCDCEVRWVQVAPTLNARDYSLFDNHVAACVARGKKAILQWSYKIFNTSNPALLMPSDFQHYSTASNGFIANVWDTNIDVMGEYIKLSLDIIARYDSNPNVEMFIFPESSTGLPTPLPAGFTRSGYATQLKRMYAALAPAAAYTIVCGQVNFTTGEIAGLIKSLYQNGCAMGDPDAYSTTANTIFNGGATDDGTAAFDYRGKMPRMMMASTAALGGAHDNGPPSNLVNFMQAGGVTHGLWVLGRPAPNDTTSIRAAINADPALLSACPTNYNGTCRAG